MTMTARRIAGGSPGAPAVAAPEALLAAVPHPVIAIAGGERVIFANPPAEQFFEMSAAWLKRQPISSLLPFGTPLLALIAQVEEHGVTVSEYGLELTTPRLPARVVDAHVSPVADQPGLVLVLLQERSIAQKMDRQLTHRQAARGVSAMSAVLAHEIKNPLAGIRGAAQLLEQEASEQDRALTQLICTETDRIRKLVDRMEVFSDRRPIDAQPVNIHEVLDHVRSLARSSFARHIQFTENFDPSLPPVMGDKDRLIQVFLNLVKNAADAIEGRNDGEIHLQTAYRPGVHLAVGGNRDRMALPLEITVRDNGDGVPAEIFPSMFEPFVTSKKKGTGLGLALVAKIVGDHGGTIECESEPRRTVFHVRLPMHRQARPNSKQDKP